MLTSTISSKGQVTVPKKIREHLHVNATDKIIFIPQEDGRVLITGVEKSAAFLYGMLKHRKPARPVSIEKMNEAVKQARARRVKA